MLKRLHISNFTLIDKIEINFKDNLTTITGQTGAGKSIILGALSLVSGKRSEANLLYDAKKKCIIEAEFDAINTIQFNAFFSQYDFDLSNTVFLRRELLPSGKSRSFINDTPATLKQLNELGGFLIDIHAQHENLKLADRKYRTFLVDAYSGSLNTYYNYLKQFEAVEKIKGELKEQENSLLKQKQEQEYFQYLLKELEDAAIQNGELKEKETILKTLESAETIKGTLIKLSSIMSNDNNGLLELAYQADREIAQVADLNKDLAKTAERISSLQIEIQDIFNEISGVDIEAGHNQDDVLVISERVNQINKLIQKHQVKNEQELHSIQLKLEKKVNKIDESESLINQLKEALVNEKEISTNLSTKLSKTRIDNAKIFADKLSKTLLLLGIPEAKFEIKIETLLEPDILGAEAIDFVFSANKGTGLKKVHDSASGGELSRILLAIKAMISEQTRLPTIVFDEIDTGVSGEVADKMGALMKLISKKIQVISITHLPQIAAKGDQHLSVYKDHNAEKTYTKIKTLDSEQRIIELAKMLSGEKISIIAKENAKVLLNN